MKRIDRLIMKALASMPVALIMATVERCGAGWTAVAHRQGGVKAEGPNVEERCHSTLEDALKYLDDLTGGTPAADDVPVIVDDIPVG